MRKKSGKIWWVLPLVIGLVLWGMFFGQKSNNSKPQMVKIGKQWDKETFDQYWEDSFGLYVPFGMHYWADKAGFSIQACRFNLPKSSNIFDVLTLLREFRNQTIDIVVPPSIYGESLARILENKLDLPKETVVDAISDPDTWEDYGFNAQTWPVMIIPNTYNFSLQTDLDGFLKRMQRESDLFWNESRQEKLRVQKLSREEAVTIASIVQKESNKTDEYTTIAGVYINRLRIGMRLMADPTLVFIRGRGGRVYNKDKDLVSPYNTYKNKGLPPGPICIPSVAAIDAVLNYSEHPYLYFCAKSDFSGYHVFERYYRNHQKNARAFHRALNRLEKRRSNTDGNKKKNRG